jgi:integral membrane protein
VWKNPVGRVRLVGMIEGVSFLLLLFVAMPLKYLWKLPEGESIVFWVGLVHGLLFIAYATVTFVAWGQGHLTRKFVGLAAIASVLPFGPFVIDRKLKAVEKEEPVTAP